MKSVDKIIKNFKSTCDELYKVASFQGKRAVELRDQADAAKAESDRAAAIASKLSSLIDG